MFKAMLFGIALLAGGPAAFAQVWPAKPVRIVVPFPPGGGTDIGTHAINVSLYKQLSYDPVKDFAPVSMVADLPLLLLVHPSVPAKSVQELIALAKSQPGKLNFSSSGAGGSMHVAAELFKSMAGVDMVHIPYKGGAPAVTNNRRSVALPDLPTISESGLPGYQSISWLALFAPAGTPKDIVNKASIETMRILKLPDVRERLLAQGAEPIGSTPEQLASILAGDIAKYARVIRESGYKPE